MHSSDQRRAPQQPRALASPAPGRTRAPRQSRGRQRVAAILDAAEALLNDVGIDAAGTTAIAARAGASVGSLYYFFPGKEAILQALAERFAAMSGAMMAAAVHDVGHGPLGRVVPHLAALIEARPAFCVVFDACGRCECASGAFLPLHEACVGQMCDLLAARLPGLPAKRRRHAAALVVSVLVGVLRELNAIPGRSRIRMLRELQVMVARYVAAYLPVRGSTDAPSPAEHEPPRSSSACRHDVRLPAAARR